MKQLPDKSIDLVLTDPPYFRIVENDWDRQWKTLAEFQEWVDTVALELKRIMNPAASLYWFCDDKVAAYCQTVLDRHFSLLNALVWRKPSTLAVKAINQLRSFAPVTERCLFYEMAASPGKPATGLQKIHSNPECFASLKQYMRAEREKLKKAKGFATTKAVDEYLNELTGTRSVVTRHYFADSQYMFPTEELYKKLQTTGFWPREYEDLRREYEDLRRVWNASDQAVDVLDYALSPTPYLHPTQKPLPLITFLLERSSKAGHLVFDPFSGSGTTAIACHNLGLDFICVERDPDYHAASVARLNKHREQMLLPLG
jgi:site-specific DNA-methyltransferase (adenine-specific)